MSDSDDNMEKKLALFAEFIKKFRIEFESIKDMLPQDVQDAHEILFQLSEIVIDPSVAEKTVNDAIFSEISSEKVKWALKVLDDWRNKDKLRAEVRKKEKERRVRNKGMEERKLSEKKIDELYNNFDTRGILDAVAGVDKIRSIFSDQFQEKGIPRPPEIRELLLKLHDKASEVINSEILCETDKGMFDLAWEIEDEIFEAMEQLEQIQKVIRGLTDLSPSEEDEDGEDE